MYRNTTVGLVVPAYNESDAVGEVIETTPWYVDRLYVVDDGSTDDTWRVIREHASEVNESRRDEAGPFDDVVVPIQHEENRGVGGAIKTGYQRAREERIEVTAVMGGDGQMDPDHLERYLDPIIDGDADYTKGNRFLERDDLDAMPRFRLVGNLTLTGLTKLASGYWEIGDPQNGYTAISLSALEEADVDAMYEYYGYCNDILVKLNVENLRVADVARPSTYNYQEGWDSHIVYSEYIPRVSGMLLRNFFWRMRESFVRNRNPAAPAYTIGMAGVAVGVLAVLGGVASLLPDGGRLGAAAIIAGATLFAIGVLLDRRANRDIAHRVVEPTGDATSSASASTHPDAIETSSH